MATLPSLITFGSLTPLPSQDQILQLKGEFHRKASLLQPLMEAVRDLDSLWTEMTAQDPALEDIDGKSTVRKLEGLLSGTVNEDISDERHNIWIVPITILNHVMQYLSFIDHIGVASHSCVMENVAANGGVQGLCAGLLSAQAVSSAMTVEDIVALSCTSLRLAFCIGAGRHANIPARIIRACEGRLDLRFGNRELVRSNFDGQIIPHYDAVRSILNSILVQPVSWYQTISTSAQSISKVPENSYILSIGGDTTTQSMRETQHIVRVKEVISADSFRDLFLK